MVYEEDDPDVPPGVIKEKARVSAMINGPLLLVQFWDARRTWCVPREFWGCPWVLKCGVRQWLPLDKLRLLGEDNSEITDYVSPHTSPLITMNRAGWGFLEWECERPTLQEYEGQGRMSGRMEVCGQITKQSISPNHSSRNAMAEMETSTVASDDAADDHTRDASSTATRAAEAGHSREAMASDARDERMS